MHIPKPILQAVDRRARALKISRNELILRALERELAGTGEWSSGLFEALAEPEPEIREAVSERVEAIRGRRRSRERYPRSPWSSFAMV